MCLFFFSVDSATVLGVGSDFHYLFRSYYPNKGNQGLTTRKNTKFKKCRFIDNFGELLLYRKFSAYFLPRRVKYGR